MAYDHVIVGGGIVGLTTARELLRRGVKRILVLEKEDYLGAHASGKNSGVLHAGIYYGSDSLKARCCSAGARKLRAYAQERNIPCVNTGKVIVATRPELTPQIDILYARSRTNGIRVEKITPEELKKIEPLAYTEGMALFSPDTSIIDSIAVLAALRHELTTSGVEVRMSEEVLSIDIKLREIQTNKARISYGHLVSASGLHADQIAHWMGVGHDYHLLPFKGVYQKVSRRLADQIKGLIYPVPDLELPFLGVHFTRTTGGDVLAGPTAAPSLGRENYHGFEGIQLGELPRLLRDLSWMMLHNSSRLRSHIRTEVAKYLPGGFFRAAKELVPSLQPSDLLPDRKVGLRAQLVNIRSMELVMDFVVEEGPHSTHVLNAVSPAFTASFAFAELIADRVLGVSSEVLIHA